MVTDEQKEVAAATAANPATDIADLKKSAERHEQLIYLVIIVLFIGVVLALIGTGTVLESYLASKQATYEDLKDQVVTQNSKIDLLIRESEKRR